MRAAPVPAGLAASPGGGGGSPASRQASLWAGAISSEEGWVSPAVGSLQLPVCPGGAAPSPRASGSASVGLRGPGRKAPVPVLHPPRGAHLGGGEGPRGSPHRDAAPLGRGRAGEEPRCRLQLGAAAGDPINYLAGDADSLIKIVL